MKYRMILPVGLLACTACFGGVKASAFEFFRMLGEQAAVEAPSAVPEPAPMEDGKLEATQKGGGSCQKDCSPVCQKGCEPCALPCRPRLRGWGKAACEPACGVKGEIACQKDCGPVCQKGCDPCARPCRPRLWGFGKACCEPACGVEVKGEVACQKDCGPVCQKGCEPFAFHARHHLRGFGRLACEPVCVDSVVQKGCWDGAEQKGSELSKDEEVQKEIQK